MTTSRRHASTWRRESTETYAEELLVDVGARAALDSLPTWLQPYVVLDGAGFARDLDSLAISGRPRLEKVQVWRSSMRRGERDSDARQRQQVVRPPAVGVGPDVRRAAVYDADPHLARAVRHPGIALRVANPLHHSRSGDLAHVTAVRIPPSHSSDVLVGIAVPVHVYRPDVDHARLPKNPTAFP
jgi:hypothetical protein